LTSLSYQEASSLVNLGEEPYTNAELGLFAAGHRHRRYEIGRQQPEQDLGVHLVRFGYHLIRGLLVYRANTCLTLTASGNCETVWR